MSNVAKPETVLFSRLNFVNGTAKLIALANSSKIQCNQKDIDSFLALCSEFEIITGERRKKVYNMSYEKAKGLIENQEI